jgi:flavin-dependent dehydrogenase
MRFLVIGAGPSGLVAAKVLLQADPTNEVWVPFLLGSFVARAWQVLLDAWQRRDRILASPYRHTLGLKMKRWSSSSAGRRLAARM